MLLTKFVAETLTAERWKTGCLHWKNDPNVTNFFAASKILALEVLNFVDS